ncbi:BURP domain-containing protein 3-like [Curcuma longa]|uniref:BURP domain-containing protein 3-like n=1 Tax=Curcuma longa TaxID=136217 RepID=UPI003D9E6AA1
MSGKGAKICNLKYKRNSAESDYITDSIFIVPNIPFRSSPPQSSRRLSIKPSSLEAETTLRKLQECERPVALDERKLYATSLELMVDFSVAHLGTRHVVAASMSVSKAGTPRQMYTIEGMTKAVATEGKLVACHVEKYAYTVFHCHTSLPCWRYCR